MVLISHGLILPELARVRCQVPGYAVIDRHQWDSQNGTWFRWNLVLLPLPLGEGAGPEAELIQ